MSPPIGNYRYETRSRTLSRDHGQHRHDYNYRNHGPEPGYPSAAARHGEKLSHRPSRGPSYTPGSSPVRNDRGSGYPKHYQNKHESMNQWHGDRSRGGPPPFHHRHYPSASHEGGDYHNDSPHAPFRQRAVPPRDDPYYPRESYPAHPASMPRVMPLNMRRTDPNQNYYDPSKPGERKRRHKVKRQRAGCLGCFNSCCCGGGCCDEPEVINGRPGGFRKGGPCRCLNWLGCCDRERIFVRRGSSVQSWHILNLDDNGLNNALDKKSSRGCC